MKLMNLLILVTLGAFLAGCASAVPKELANARAAYHQASMGPAAELAPAELHKAQKALTLAEQSFLEAMDPRNEIDSYKTRDLAYVAQRKAELAEASGSIALHKAKQAKAVVDFRTETIKQGKEDLRDSEQQRAATEQALRDSRQQTAATEQALRHSEQQTVDALAELATIAALKEEERGLVLTLSGAFLFRSAESALLPTARVKLEQVSNALRGIRNRKLIVEGHTDSQGSEAYNQTLSQHRADEVRSFLVQRGYPADFIQAIGKGENRPIADNASAEGRANNRRVEIVIQHESKMSESYTLNQ
jgi:outer membrane protein OmpA-like peptidoglycan-associated protein